MLFEDSIDDSFHAHWRVLTNLSLFFGTNSFEYCLVNITTTKSSDLSGGLRAHEKSNLCVFIISPSLGTIKTLKSMPLFAILKIICILKITPIENIWKLLSKHVQEVLMQSLNVCKACSKNQVIDCWKHDRWKNVGMENKSVTLGEAARECKKLKKILHFYT